MASKGKKISELTALTSASLQTTLVGVDNGTTYKVTLDVLEDAIISMVSRSTDLRLDSLEEYTASVGAEIDLTPLNSFTSSQSTLNSAFTTGINARLQTSSFNEFSASVHSEILAATNEQDLSAYVTTLVVNTLSGSVDGRLDSLEGSSGSYLTSLNGTISGSSQLTSSYDERYVLSGSITQTTWDNIANKPSGIVSQSTDLSSLNSFTQSVDSRVDSLESWSSSLTDTFATDLEVSIVSSSVAATIGIISQNTGLVSTSSFNSYTASISTASLVTSISNLNSATSSYEIKGSGILSGSVSYNDLTNIPSGIVSQSTDLNSLNTFTQSIDSRVDSLENATSSYLTSLSGAISSSAQVVGILSSLNSYTSSLNNAIELTGSTVSFLGNIIVYGTQSVINSQNVEISDNILYLSPTASTDNDLGVVGHYNDGTYRHAGIFMDASDGHSWKVFNGLQTETTATVDTAGTGFTLADFKAGAITGTSFSGQINSTNGVISGSSQLTSSFDTRYAASGSVGSSVNTSSLATTGSNSFNGNQTITGSLIVSAVAVVNGGVTIPTGSTITLTSGSSISVDASGAITGSLTGSVFGIGDVVAFSSSVNSRLNSVGGVAGTISSSAQITAFGFVSGSYETTGRSIVSGSSQIVSLLPTGVISGSSQLTSSYDVRYTLSGSVSAVPSGTISGSAQITSFGFVSSSATIPNGTISGSAQITAFGFVSSSTSVPAGTISGSSQLTSSFDGRYTQTGSFNTLTASFNSFTASAQSVTTGSNSFNGTQTITGSLIITTGSFVASQILANTASLYLTSGSNLYVQNNGVVEITGSLLVSGSTMFVSAGGDEGGEIQFGVPTTNTTLSTRVVADVWQNRFRIFDGSTKGAYLDIASQSTGVGSEILTRASTNILATPAWTSAGGITLTATTTSPTKGTIATDNISYRQLGTKQWEVVMTYNQSSSTGGASGTGDYLITLPNGLSFDTTLPSQTIYTSNVATNTWVHNAYVIPNGNGTITNNTVGGNIFPMVYSATTFRILTLTYGSGIQCWGSGFYSVGGDAPKIQLSFRFTST